MRPQTTLTRRPVAAGFLAARRRGRCHAGIRESCTAMGPWLQQDPAAYIDGSNLYQGFDSQPSAHVDPWGSWTTDPEPWTMDHAVVTAQPGDTLTDLARRITGSGDIPVGTDRTLKGGEQYDITPLLRYLDAALRKRVVDNARGFNGSFGPAPRLGTDAADIRKYFEEDSVKSTDCSGAIFVIFKKAILDVFGDGRFDAVFGKGDHKPVPITPADAKSPPKPGDHVNWRNRNPYQFRNAWGNEHTIYLGGDQYWGNGLNEDLDGPGVETEKGIIATLDDIYDYNYFGALAEGQTVKPRPDGADAAPARADVSHIDTPAVARLMFEN